MPPKPSKPETLLRLKSRGYWDISIHPVEYKKDRFPPDTLRPLIEKHAVELRGWDYPHFDRGDTPPYNIPDGVEQYVQWWNHIEFWRVTTSGNFRHLLALREDWAEEDLSYIRRPFPGFKPLGVLSTLYTICEIFEFSRRIVRTEAYGDQIKISFSLNNMQAHELVVDGADRLPFSVHRKNESGTGCWIYEPRITSAIELEEQIESFILDAFSRLTFIFNWSPLPKALIKSDIERFRTGKLL